MKTCHYCGKHDQVEGDFRPYGPGRTWICHPCMKSTPEREAASDAVFVAMCVEIIDRGEEVVLTDDGPIGISKEEAKRLAATGELFEMEPPRDIQ